MAGPSKAGPTHSPPALLRLELRELSGDGLYNALVPAPPAGAAAKPRMWGGVVLSRKACLTAPALRRWLCGGFLLGILVARAGLQLSNVVVPPHQGW